MALVPQNCEYCGQQFFKCAERFHHEKICPEREKHDAWEKEKKQADALQGLVDHRLKNFAVRTVDTGSRGRAMFDGEFILEVTHNGQNWNGITIAPQEIDRIVEELIIRRKKLRERGLV